MLRIHNTLTKQKDEFRPVTPNVVRIYSCGLTVYAPMHIGHARTYCFWDVVRRYLEYRGFHVVSVINYTDIDDRIIQKADASTGFLDVAEDNSARFRRDCRALRIKDYAVYTRATDFIAEQIDMVARLLDKGHAYVVDGEVFYDVTSFPGYGKLSGRKLDEQQTGASGRVGEDAARKRHPADFTLWKPSKEGEPVWSTGEEGWPDGRPGWHIECSAMSSTVLGDTFDIHGGAIDNLFPHHENEVAQSEPLCGHTPWVKYWMHPEHLDLSGVKMSKSIGNVISVPDLLARHRYDEIRWFFATNHYRTKVSFSDEIVDASSEGYLRITRLLDILEDRLASVDEADRRIPAPGRYASLRPDGGVPRMRHRYVHGAFGESTGRFIDRFIAAMDDDFGSPQATAALFDYVGELYAAGIDETEDWPSALAAYQALTRHLHVFGIERPNEALHPDVAADSIGSADTSEAVAPYEKVLDRLLAIRQQARASKDFAKADVLRDVLKEAGVTIEDTKDGTRWLLHD